MTQTLPRPRAPEPILSARAPDFPTLARGKSVTGTRAPSRTRPAAGLVAGFAAAGLLLGGSLGCLAGTFLKDHPAQQAMLAPTLKRLPAPPTLPLAGHDHLTVLLMGSDATANGRVSSHGNTDTMLLARFDLAHRDVRLISIPRDTRVPIPGHRTFKVNAANPYGGPQLAVRTVSDFLDVPIDRYFLVSLDGVMAAVDAVGGVDVTIPKRVDYDDWTGRLHIHFAKGRCHLDGRQVEAYIRFRHDGGGDIGRVKRQQDFLREVMGQVLTPVNLVRAPGLWSLLASKAQTDLSPTEALQVLACMQGARDHGLQIATLPGDSEYAYGYSYWIVDREVARRAVQRTFSGLPATRPHAG